MTDKVDLLHVDPSFNDYKFYTVSFLTPQGVLRSDVYGLKVRGFYKTQEEAEKHIKELQNLDKKNGFCVPIYLGNVGMWCPWDQSPPEHTPVKYDDNDSNALEAIITEHVKNNEKVKERLNERAIQTKKKSNYLNNLKKERKQK